MSNNFNLSCRMRILGRNAVLSQWLLAVVLNVLQILNNLIISADHVHSWFSVVSNAVKPAHYAVGPNP